MLWVADNDPSRWRYKRRHTILGLWHDIKRSMWQDHIAQCGESAGEISYMGFEVY